MSSRDSDEESLGPWIVAVASVVFDIDVGQRLEAVVPDGAITEPEARDVAFHSFPDSMSMELHSRSSIRDSTFWFRIKRQQAAAREAGGPDATGRPDSGGQASTSGREHYHNQRQEYLYGFVLCRQRQDSRLKRGGEQKSLVLLSRHPLSGALSACALWAGPIYFNQGPAALDSVWQEVLGWDPPVPSARQLLRLASATEVVQVPHLLALPPPTPEGDAEALAEQPLEVALPPLDGMQPAFADADVYTPLKGILERAWGVWELLVLAEPLMVCAPSPGECSAAVAALVALIGPLPYSADFRPYFTIHDTAFQELSAAAASSPPGAGHAGGLPRLLGVTNLYFLKALPAWPNVLSVGARPGGGEGGERAHMPSRLERAVRRRPAGPLSLLAEHREAAWLAYRPLSRPDKALLERLLPPPPPGGPPDRAARVAAANSAALRRHFAELTHALLAPLDACCRPLPPPPGVGPLTQRPPAHLPPFSRGDFLDGLARAELPPALLQRFGGKAGCAHFYRRFLESPNFASWFERRRGRAAAWQQAAWARAVAERGLESQLLGAASEPELVEAFAALERRLGAASEAAAAGSPRARLRAGALQKQLGACFQRMPRDLQGCILSNPSRAALLQRLAPAARVPGLPIAHHGSDLRDDASQ